MRKGLKKWNNVGRKVKCREECEVHTWNLIWVEYAEGLYSGTLRGKARSVADVLPTTDPAEAMVFVSGK